VGYRLAQTPRGGVAAGPLGPQNLRPPPVILADFRERLRQRSTTLSSDPGAATDFIREMQRFLPAATVTETVNQKEFWQYLTNLIQEECALVLAAPPGPGLSPPV